MARLAQSSASWRARAGALTLTLLALAALPLGLAVAAEPLSPYEAMGAPSHPRVEARWDRYYDYAEATALLRSLAESFPELATLESLGRSYGDREMWVLTLTNSETGPATDKPAFWIDGGIHANELQGCEVTLYTAWFLLESYGHNAWTTRLLDRRTFYLLPMMSPDGRDAHMHEPNTTHSPRSGLRPVDDDLDGLVDEDGPDDLDGDGSIVQMRIRDPQGRMVPHPRFPDLLVPAEPDQPGMYRLLGWEGIDNDGDGAINEDGPGYYDPNRDWAWQWQPRYVQGGAHHYPFSIPEVRLAADFIMAHPNIAGAQSYHNCSGMILRGPGVRSQRLARGDRAVFDAIAHRGELMLPGYRYLSVGTGLYEVFGGEFDWLYGMRGIVAFTDELFTDFNLFRDKAKGRIPDREERVRAFDRYLLFGQGTVSWHPVDHPRYGRIEVGGLRKEWRRQPPSFLLEEECHRNMAFTLYHASQMPRVELTALSARPLGGGIREVTATVANPCLTPTRLAQDREHHITPSDLVTLSGEDLRVLCGLVSSDRFFRRAREQERHPERLRLDAVPGMGAVHVRWLVEGEGPLTVTARSVKGGRATRTLP